MDTGYGTLAWPLRKDERVVVTERTNALYCDPPEPVDLVVSDVAWTPQKLIVPAAMRWVKPGSKTRAGGLILSLLKPHYELAKMQRRKPSQRLAEGQAREVCLKVSQQLAELGCTVRAVMQSVLLGKGGNAEFVLLLQAAS